MLSYADDKNDYSWLIGKVVRDRCHVLAGEIVEVVNEVDGYGHAVWYAVTDKDNRFKCADFTRTVVDTNATFVSVLDENELANILNAQAAEKREYIKFPPLKEKVNSFKWTPPPRTPVKTRNVPTFDEIIYD